MSPQGQRPARLWGAVAAGAGIEEFQLLPRRQVVFTMAGVMLALFLGSLDQTVVGTAMPRIIADLGGFNRYTWVTTAYLVASTTVVPIVGRLTDMYGRKWFYIAGIAIFLLGSILAGLSQSMNQLIAFRALQGIGGGIMIANAFVSIGDLFPPSERGKYLGFMAAAFSLSSVIGPTLGGFITETLSWHWIFYINIPLGIPLIALFMRFFPQNRHAGGQHRLDYLGALLLILAVIALLIGLSWGGSHYGWTSPQVLGALGVATVTTVLFVLIELRVPEPIMPLTLFQNGVVSISLLATFFTGFAMFGGFIFIPLFFQGVLNASPTSSGSFMTPMMLGMAAGGTLSGQALSRLGGHYRIQGLIGLAIATTGVFLLSRMTVETSYAQAVFNIVLMGFGLGSTFPVFTIAIQNAVHYRFMGVATSTSQFVQSIGGTLGLALLGSFMVSRFNHHLAATIPSAVRDALPADRLTQVTSNPQALVSPGAMANLQRTFSQLGDQGVLWGQQLVGALRESLASAVNDVFLISLAVLVLAFVATIFLKEIPLKRRQRQGVEASSPAPQ